MCTKIRMYVVVLRYRHYMVFLYANKLKELTFFVQIGWRIGPCSVLEMFINYFPSFYIQICASFFSLYLTAAVGLHFRSLLFITYESEVFVGLHYIYPIALVLHFCLGFQYFFNQDWVFNTKQLKLRLEKLINMLYALWSWKSSHSRFDYGWLQNWHSTALFLYFC